MTQEVGRVGDHWGKAAAKPNAPIDEVKLPPSTGGAALSFLLVCNSKRHYAPPADIAWIALARAKQFIEDLRRVWVLRGCPKLD